MQRSSTQKKNTKSFLQIAYPVSAYVRAPGARRKPLTESYSTNQLVLAPHQKDEEQPRRVNNKHDEAYRVLPREMVRRP